MRLLGQTKFGVYHDDCEGIHPDIIEEYYGVDGPPLVRQRHQSGAGHPADEDDNGDGVTIDQASVTKAIIDQQHQHACHEAVHVLCTGNPFVNAKLEEDFFAVLGEVITQQITPNNFNLTPEEWEDGQYPIYETIYVGCHASKELHISLAEPIWYQWACLWCQALVMLSHFMTDATANY
jgi:hypothetical protein